MRSRTPPDLSNRCPSCWLQLGFCLCAQVPRIETNTRLVFIRHALERWKTTNTVRVAMLALPNAELWEYGGPEARFDEAVLREPDTWLLFPDVGETTEVVRPPKRLVVVDGSWPQARKMVQRIEAFRGMPRLSLRAPGLATQRLRQPPHPEGRSTLEALADALSMLEGSEKGAPLHTLHDLMAKRVLEVREAGGDIVRRLEKDRTG
jgi:DTW domain-containing protein YfiP